MISAVNRKDGRKAAAMQCRWYCRPELVGYKHAARESMLDERDGQRATYANRITFVCSSDRLAAD